VSDGGVCLSRIRQTLAGIRSKTVAGRQNLNVRSRETIRTDRDVEGHRSERRIRIPSRKAKRKKHPQSYLHEMTKETDGRYFLKVKMTAIDGKDRVLVKTGDVRKGVSTVVVKVVVGVKRKSRWTVLTRKK
jgi:hypothetical protein